MATGRVIRGLGGPAGFGEAALARSDDGSFALDARAVFPGGLTYFGRHHAGDAIRVGTNGIVSFGAGVEVYPAVGSPLPVADMIAPFWADVDTRIDGEGRESGQIWVDLDPEGGHLTVTWADVGSYRRQADETNLFQLRLTDRGAGDFDIRFAYERIDWTSGTASDDAGAMVLLNGVRLPEAWIAAGDAGALASQAGNTGIAGTWQFEMRDGILPGLTPVSGATLTGTDAANTLTGGADGDILRGYEGTDVLRGHGGADWLFGGDGADTLNGGSGDDVIEGGTSAADLRDVVYGGDGADRIDAGHGNDLVYGGAGDDVIEGGFGVDELIGQQGDDTLSGAAWSDLIFGGDGADFLNGGFGYDRLNGGGGGDRFFHLGIFDHGSDWVQDYSAAEGDALVWGRGPATAADFQINWADTAGAGAAGVAEAFVIHRGTGQIIWALVDGAAQEEITLLVSGTGYDLLG
ncbi:Nidogen, extracellular region [Pseudooceanicola batsensis HTCC2597]|uniref:Nidogen, extracellular region n=1 Tax=Pseudooceanicola batsensis (strain ATCC BAA-863 / DSM 15984 / KCTC 12145 / HTCC2597) TaxID=252305 RepID=A3TY51_PSEBH|nr:nidogen-like domain-containing protein [Pseudooceanicola batsensis]EAQ03085.1 Nidogen, extracellular region [Pseudooceanicola batsensis HTCC2597]